MTSLHYGLPTRLDYSALLDAISDYDLGTATRSTVPLVAYWRDHDLRLGEFADGLGVSTSAQLCFEYPTKSLPGRRASMTDLMVLASDAAVAVEAKWTEPRYRTVEKWLSNTTTGVEVLQHWLDLIAPYSTPTAPEAVSDCVYQMLHRTASACAQGREQAHVVYQVFESPEAKYDPASDLAGLKAILRPSERLRFWVHRVGLRSTAAHAALVADDSGDIFERAQRTRAALLADDPLFEFGAAQPVELEPLPA